MTVCIAARYVRSWEPLAEGVILVADSQITDQTTGIKSDTGFKLGTFTQNVVVLGADDMVKFRDVMERANDKVDDLVSFETMTALKASKLYVEAERDWRADYLERHVLSKYNITWDQLYSKLANDELPQKFLDMVKDDIDKVVIPYQTEALMVSLYQVGVKSSQAHLFKITPKMGAENVRDQGYGVIGGGDITAENEFRQAGFGPHFGKAATMFLCYLAKRRSEIVEGVGTTTNLFIYEHDADPKLNEVPKRIREGFDTIFDELSKSRKNAEDNAYERAKELVSK